MSAPPEWIAVEHRVLGLDRRTFRPALVALVVALLLAYGWPALDAALPWHNETKPGDVLDLGDGATAVPPVGWQLESGTLAGAGSVSPTSVDVRLATGGATISLRGAPFTGSADAFLDQVLRSEGAQGVDGSRGTLTTAAGLVGVVQGATGPSGDQVVAAFKMAPGNGDTAPALLVTVRTAPGQFEHYQDSVGELLHGITPGAGR
ncbi:hypothetical protein [Lentzea sp. NPDC059081]|uniref:hypothetical protein n=1 Tax=Lentzea sp. NPDC059081 TaxID=3346719 RepID=UPI003694482C